MIDMLYIYLLIAVFIVTSSISVPINPYNPSPTLPTAYTRIYTHCLSLFTPKEPAGVSERKREGAFQGPGMRVELRKK